MIRVSELKLPLSAVQYHPDSHTEYLPLEPLRALAARQLGIAEEAIASVHVHKRSFDARKAELLAVYIVDLTLADESQEAALLEQFSSHAHVNPDRKSTRLNSSHLV